MAKGEALDQAKQRSLRIDRMNMWTTGSPSVHVLKIKSYNGSDETRGGRILTVGSRFDGRDWMRFITLIKRSNLDTPSRSNGCEIIETVHYGPFHRNR